MKKQLTAIALLIAAAAGAQKEDLVAKYSRFIDSTDLRTHLTVLASDAYEGRETGKKGQKMTAEYLINSFKQDGCSMAPGMTVFEQTFDVIETQPGGALTFGSTKLEFKKDFVYSGAKRQVLLKDAPVHTLESLTKQPVEGAVLIYVLKGMDLRSELSALRKKAPKVRAIIVVTSKYDDLYESLQHYATNKTMRLADDPVKEETPVIIVRSEALITSVKKPFGYIVGKGKQKELKKGRAVANLSGELNLAEVRLTSSNVLAFIPGSDPILSKEVVVITAHYDHIGIENGVVYNGADDDGTGTVALLEIAEAFMTAKKQGKAPRRSILIMPVSGEEKGLLGSSYYASHPVIPLEMTVADLNIDMIGRNDIAHENSDYVYIIGSNMLSTDLHNANELANNTWTFLKLDYKFNDKNDPNQFYYRSDHYNFAKNNIPSIFYFSGIHEDYHQPTDDIEKINFKKVEKVARLVFATAWTLANADRRPALDY